MSDPLDRSLELGLLGRMLTTTHRCVHVVAAEYEQGAVNDVGSCLAHHLLGHGMGLSPEWIRHAADRIRAGEPPVLPTLDQLDEAG